LYQCWKSGSEVEQKPVFGLPLVRDLKEGQKRAFLVGKKVKGRLFDMKSRPMVHQMTIDLMSKNLLKPFKQILKSSISTTKTQVILEKAYFLGKVLVKVKFPDS
jgi:hypothetical protein